MCYCTFTLFFNPNIILVKASVKIDCLKSTGDLVDSLIFPVIFNCYNFYGYLLKYIYLSEYLIV